MRVKRDFGSVVSIKEDWRSEGRRGTSEGQQHDPMHFTTGICACSSAIWALTDVVKVYPFNSGFLGHTTLCFLLKHQAPRLSGTGACENPDCFFILRGPIILARAERGVARLRALDCEAEL